MLEITPQNLLGYLHGFVGNQTGPFSFLVTSEGGHEWRRHVD